MLTGRNTYVRLWNGEDEAAVKSRPNRCVRGLLLLSAGLNLVLLALLCMSALGVLNTPSEETGSNLYSPAQDAVRTKLVKFTRGVAHDVPLYDRKPSPAVDEAWQRLYEFTETKIPSEQAAKMPNRTWPFLGDEENYIVALDVFHQLHCLDMLRQQLHPGHNYTVLPMGHIRHCIGTIRQSLMCASDITPIVWQWSDKWRLAEPRDDVVHVCRDFGKIQDWARDRFEKFPDLSIYIEDDLAKGGEV